MAHRASMAEPEASISARPVGQDLVGEPSSAIRWHSAACPSLTTSWRRPLRRAGRPAPWAKRRQRRCRKRPPPDRAWWRSPEGGSPPRAQPAGSRSAAPVSHAKATAGAGAARCDAARAMRDPWGRYIHSGACRCGRRKPSLRGHRALPLRSGNRRGRDGRCWRVLPRRCSPRPFGTPRRHAYSLPSMLRAMIIFMICGVPSAMTWPRTSR